jgi:uncharacterized protein (DUF433 family)
VSDPKILSGKPCIQGTRLSVEFILELIASGGTAETIAVKYPQLQPNDVVQAVQFAAHMLKTTNVMQTRVAG